MCRPARCATCENTTWAGCGMHVDQVMARVPARDRCTCDGDGRSATRSQRSGGGSLLGRMLGR